MKLTVFQRFKEKWKDGCGHSQCDTAYKVVLCKGKLPCDILFVGEAPGQSEDTLGIPFVGPAGILLDEIIASAVGCKTLADIQSSQDPSLLSSREWARFNLRCAFTNIVCCIPLSDEGGKMVEPDDEQVISCQPRLKEFIEEVAKPKLIITVGKCAREWLDPMYKHGLKLKNKIPQETMNHPAFILRKSEAEKRILIRREKLQLMNVVEKHFVPEEES